MRPQVTVSSKTSRLSQTYSEEWDAMERAKEELEHMGCIVKLLSTGDKSQWLIKGSVLTPPIVKLTVSLDTADVFDGRAAPLLAEWIESNVRSLIGQLRQLMPAGIPYVTIKQPVGKQWGSVQVLYECQVTVTIF
jgi:hypothetical protein